MEKQVVLNLKMKKSKKLAKLAVKDIKDETKKITKKNFVHSAYDKTYNFNKYTHLGDLANRIYDKELSFGEAQKEQEELLEELEELEKRISPERGKQPSKKIKKAWKRW